MATPRIIYESKQRLQKGRDIPRKKDSEKTSSVLKLLMVLLIDSLVIFESFVTMTVIGSTSAEKDPLNGAIDSGGM